MLYCVSAKNRQHLIELLRVIEERDGITQAVDTQSFSFEIDHLDYWLYSELTERRAVVTPPFVW